MTLSEQIVYAMFKPSRYRELVELKKGRFALFVTVLMIVLGIVSFAIPAGATITGFGGFKTLFSNQLKTIRYEDGGLKLDTRFHMEVSGIDILIITDEEEVPDSEMSRNGVYVAVGSRVMSIVTSMDGTIMHYQDMDISVLFDEGFNNESLITAIPRIYMYMFFIFVARCAGFFIKYGSIAVLFGLFINTVNKSMHMNMSFGEVFRLCFYGQTLGIIISNFNQALGLLPAMLVSLICVFVSVRMITSAIMYFNPRNYV